MENPFKKENIKKIAKIGLLSTALAMSPTEDIDAQTNKQEQGVSQNTNWAKEALNIANKDIKYINNEKDAFEYAVKICKLFTAQIGILAEESNKDRNYSLEEYQYLLKQTQKVYEIIKTLDNNYNMNRSAVLDNVINILEKRSTYGGYNEYMRIKNFKM